MDDIEKRAEEYARDHFDDTRGVALDAYIAGARVERELMRGLLTAATKAGKSLQTECERLQLEVRCGLEDNAQPKWPKHFLDGAFQNRVDAGAEFLREGKRMDEEEINRYAVCTGKAGGQQVAAEMTLLLLREENARLRAALEEIAAMSINVPDPGLGLVSMAHEAAKVARRALFK